MNGAPEPAEVKAGVATLRETVKWTVGGLAAVAAAVIAGSPLTGLGSLGWGWRIGFAVAGASAGFAALGYVVWTSIDVLAARRLTFQGLVDEKALPPARQHRLERNLADMFPGRMVSFKAIGEERARLRGEIAVAKRPRLNQLEKDLETLRLHSIELFDTFDFDEIRDRFLTLRRRSFAAAVLMIASFGVFAWAANPGKDSEPWLAEPYVHFLTPRADELARLHGKLSDACLRVPLHVLVLREHASGLQDGVMLAPDCPPTRVVLRDKGATIAPQGPG